MKCPTPGCGRRSEAKSGRCTRCHRVARLKLDPAEYIRRIQGPCDNPLCGAVGRLEQDHDHACCPDHRDHCGACHRGYVCRGCNALIRNYEAGMRWPRPLEARKQGVQQYLATGRH